MQNLQHKEQSNQYYSSVSDQYDKLMDSAAVNFRVRSFVKEYFARNIAAKNLMDFGGGTGADLTWLLEQDRRVWFCEPSKGMLAQAKNRLNYIRGNDRVIILSEDRTDFSSWKTNPPVEERLDAVLANFAVLNCIENLEALFQSLSTILKPEGSLCVLVLKNNPKVVLKNYFRPLISSLLKGTTIIQRIKNGENEFPVFIYRYSFIQKCASDFFRVEYMKEIPDSPFTFVHFVRK
jgi:ubiquinone/menaquinone biosynthesis C-methylase UbiE